MINNNVPLVSFVIPTHNRVNLLKDCLDSVINQTYNNFEVIIVNDNSTDKTEDLLIEYCRKYSNCYYFQNEGNGGNAARNLGILKSKGEYIAFMDDDDICEAFRLEEQMKPILENSDYDFVISGYQILNNQGKVIEKVNYLKPLGSVGFPQRWLVKKETLMKTNMFDINQPALQDVEFYWRLKESAHIYFSRNPVVNIRVTQYSLTKNHIKMINGITRLLELHGNKMSVFEKNVWSVTLCKKLASSGDWDKFYKCFGKINKLKTPFSSLILLIGFIFKNKNILKLHSRLFSFYFRYRYSAFLNTQNY